VVAELDFSSSSHIKMAGLQTLQPPRYAALHSTLRLEMGAFLEDIFAGQARSPITTALENIVDAHAELQACLVKKPSST
jgi:hypothetical protein